MVEKLVMGSANSYVLVIDLVLVLNECTLGGTWGAGFRGSPSANQPTSSVIPLPASSIQT